MSVICNLNQCWDVSGDWTRPQPAPRPAPSTQWHTFSSGQASASWNYACGIMHGSSTLPPLSYTLTHMTSSSEPTNDDTSPNPPPLSPDQPTDYAAYLLALLPPDFIQITPSISPPAFHALINAALDSSTTTTTFLLWLHTKYTAGVEICWPLTDWHLYLTSYATPIDGLRSFFVAPRSLRDGPSATPLWDGSHGTIRRTGAPICLDAQSAFRGEVANVLAAVVRALDRDKRGLSAVRRANWVAVELIKYAHPFLRAVGGAAVQNYGCPTRLAPCITNLVLNRVVWPLDLDHMLVMLSEVVQHGIPACIVFGDTTKVPSGYAGIHGGYD